MLSREKAIKAYRAGVEAGAAGHLVTSCPHDPYTLLSRTLLRYWLRGWTDGAGNTPTN